MLDMMRKARLLFPYAFLLTPFLLLSAENAALNNLNARVTKLEKEMDSRKWYNPPAGAQVVGGYHIYAIGEFLWWKAEEDGLPFTYKTNNPLGNSQENSIQLKEMDFDWDVGYRVGGGFNFRHDKWEVGFLWTHLNTESRTQSNAVDGDALFPYWVFPDGIAGMDFFAEAKAHWKLFLNMGDLELSKEYFVGKRLSMRPFIGARTAWIDQEFNVEYKNVLFVLGQSLDDSVRMKSDYWGLGPRIGLGTQWWITKRFNIYGEAAIDLLYGEFNIKQKEQATIEPIDQQLEPLHFKSLFHIARPITDLAIGFGWDSLFFDDRLHVGVKVGWEQHIFFDQNQFIRFVTSSITSLLSNRGDLALEGLVASLRLDF